MLKLILTLVVLAGIVGTADAQSRNCRTTCTGYGNSQTCNTYCW